MTDQPITQEETLKPTLGEEIRELYSRVARLNDAVSALLAPAWGSEVGLIPSEHPLYVGEQPVTGEQGAPVDYAAHSRLLAEAFGRTLARHGYEVHELVLHSLADTALRAGAADHQRAEAAETALDRVRELAVLIRYGAPWARNRGGLADRILDAATVRRPGNETAAEQPGPAATDSAT